MGSVELTEVERRILPKCIFYWSQSVVNQSIRILETCNTKEDVSYFLKECEGNIRGLDEKCRIIWNSHIQSFGGDEYAYLIYFYSDKLSSPIKVSLRIDTFEQTIVVGNIEIADKKEAKKLDKHLGGIKTECNAETGGEEEDEE